MKLEAKQRLRGDLISQIAQACLAADRQLQAACNLTAATEDLATYIQRITKGHHIHKIGNGVEGIVFEHPTMKNVVVKLCPWTSGNSAWARLCFKQHGNRWLPVILHLSQTKLSVMGQTATFAVIFTEKLTPVSPKKVFEQIGAVFQDLSGGKPGKYLNDHLESKPKDLKDAVKLVLTGYPKYRIDLHSDNYMLRGQQIVFNDPWYLQDGRVYSPDILEDIYNIAPN